MKRIFKNNHILLLILITLFLLSGYSYSHNNSKEDGISANITDSDIATDSIIIRLKKIPDVLKLYQPHQPCWAKWLQELLGDEVKVKSVRPSGRRSTDYVTESSIIEVILAQKALPEQILKAVECAEKSNWITWAEVNPIWYSHAGTDDERYGEQWYLGQISVPAAWDITTGSQDVVVAVIDTGVDWHHEDLSDVIWINEAEFTGTTGIDDDNNGYIDDIRGWDFVTLDPDYSHDGAPADSDPNDPPAVGHGTHIAGIIGAVGNNGIGIAGVAHGVRIMPLRAGEFSYKASDVTEALYYAVDNGAKIVNMSFGGPVPFEGMLEAIEYATSRNVLLISSAGNDATDVYNFPAVCQQIIAVAALNETNNRSEMSRYGTWIDIAAPGTDILSTKPENNYATMNGTSQASAIVSGVAALTASAHPYLSADQLRIKLLAAVDDINSLNTHYSGLLGAGVIDAAKAAGPVLSETRAYIAGVFASETSGNGDQIIGPGESASIAVSLHFTSVNLNVDINLISNDPWVTVTDGPISINPIKDRTKVATFNIDISSGVPEDYIPALSLEIQNTTGTVILYTPIEIKIASSWREHSLPFSSSRSLIEMADGRKALVADNIFNDYDMWGNHLGNPKDYVYASFIDTDGSFTPPVILSETGHSARTPSAIITPDGDIHVAYHQFVDSYDNVKFPGYVRYDSATEQWDSWEFVSTNSVKNSSLWYNQTVSIAQGSNSTIYVAWFSLNKEVMIETKEPGSEWIPLSVMTIEEENAALNLIDVDGILKLFVQPFGTEGLTYFEPVYMLEFDGTAWSTPVLTSGVTGSEYAKLPFSFGNQIYRYYTTEEGGPLYLANLINESWYFSQIVSQDTTTMFERGLTSIMLDQTSFAVYGLYPVSETSGSTRGLSQNISGNITNWLLPGDSRLLATAPYITVDNTGALHAFTSEFLLVRSGPGKFRERPEATSYITQAPIVPDALPTKPVVLDDGLTTAYNNTLHATWTSTHSAGIKSYSIAWGTIPGGCDIMMWKETTETQGNFELGDIKLLPGQTVYASVKAHSEAVLSSTIGISDGITFTPAEKGDVNNNGNIDIIDALIIAQYYVGLNPSGFITPIETGDANCNGSVDIIDALIVAQYYVGLVPELCPLG